MNDRTIAMNTTDGIAVSTMPKYRKPNKPVVAAPMVPAYAATIHKSQGSEYPAVVIPVMTQQYTMLQRNLLYTGVTRGETPARLWGQGAKQCSARRDRPPALQAMIRWPAAVLTRPKNASQRPTAWLTISDSNFDVRRENSSL